MLTADQKTSDSNVGTQQQSQTSSEQYYKE